MYFCYFVLSPIGKCGALHLNKLESFFTQGCNVLSLVKTGPVVLENRMKMLKVCNNDDDGRRTNLTWAFDLGELKITWPISTNLGTTYSKVTCILIVCSNEGPTPFIIGDKRQIVKIHSQLLKPPSQESRLIPFKLYTNHP